ncbi:DUF1513 domain-containing protein [Thalassospira sp.]|uniref:DUF1513 domain-containing protein n=1 Tax=Thalassospira sp. TaxID=1912094 RepID=UPI0027368B60|nr:DUF1513 domain-containing protein [Thalassospira sp.]MDP2697411.1 DUF1513 domain-containing protein [Thalassospira sp.]
MDDFATGRRDILRLIGLGGAMTLLPVGLVHAATPDPAPQDRAVYLSASAGDNHDYYVSAFNAAGDILFQQALPGRGHDLGLRPRHVDVAVMERRPGLYGLILDRHNGDIRAKLFAPKDRRFYGHAIYSANGRYLYVTENDFDRARGVVSVWDAGDGYRRVAEFDSYGTGPHELHLMPDGDGIVIANGGLHTHPDDQDGRAPLNLDVMTPNIAIIDRHSGKLLHQTALPGDLHQLSIRHLDVSATGLIAAGFQYQGALSDAVPLVGIWQPGDGSGLNALPAPDNVQYRMRQYCGSVRFDASGSVFGVSCPRGGLMTFWDVAGQNFLTHIAAPDGCGLTATGRKGEFVGTSGLGTGWRFDAIHRARVELPGDSLKSRHWDNHLRRLPA